MPQRTKGKKNIKQEEIATHYQSPSDGLWYPSPVCKHIRTTSYNKNKVEDGGLYCTVCHEPVKPPPYSMFKDKTKEATSDYTKEPIISDKEKLRAREQAELNARLARGIA